MANLGRAGTPLYNQDYVDTTNILYDWSLFGEGTALGTQGGSTAVMPILTDFNQYSQAKQADMAFNNAVASANGALVTSAIGNVYARSAEVNYNSAVSSMLSQNIYASGVYNPANNRDYNAKGRPVTFPGSIGGVPGGFVGYSSTGPTQAGAEAADYRNFLAQTSSNIDAGISATLASDPLVRVPPGTTDAQFWSHFSELFQAQDATAAYNNQRPVDYFDYGAHMGLGTTKNSVARQISQLNPITYSSGTKYMEAGIGTVSTSEGNAYFAQPTGALVTQDNLRTNWTPSINVDRPPTHYVQTNPTDLAGFPINWDGTKEPFLQGSSTPGSYSANYPDLYSQYSSGSITGRSLFDQAWQRNIMNDFDSIGSNNFSFNIPSPQRVYTSFNASGGGSYSGTGVRF